MIALGRLPRCTVIPAELARKGTVGVGATSELLTAHYPRSGRAMRGLILGRESAPSHGVEGFGDGGQQAKWVVLDVAHHHRRVPEVPAIPERRE